MVRISLSTQALDTPKMRAGPFRGHFDIFLMTLGPKTADFAKGGGSNFSKYKALDTPQMPAGPFRGHFDIFSMTLGPKKAGFCKIGRFEFL